ncbi:MAG: 6-phosphogluconolactonase, partial [Terriglobia bacterium]
MNRMTLTYPVLNAAAELIFLVAGADKAETLRRVLGGANGAPEFPSQGIRPVNGQVRWYLDPDAARLL